MARTPILLNDLKRHNHLLLDEFNRDFERVNSRGWYILGPEVETFEEEFASYLGISYCRGLANGTDALELSLLACGVRPGDHVATTANAGMYSTTAIKKVNAVPVFIEIDPYRMTMSPAALENALTGEVRAVIVTHIYGQMADMVSLTIIARQAGIPLIEDCAQAHGAELQGKCAGTWGDIGCFSFYPTKNLGALGDGGAVVTNEETLANNILKLRQYGWEQKYRSVMSGGRNSRLDEIQAAFLLTKLRYLDEWNQRRRDIARLYCESFRELNLGLPFSTGPDYVAHLFVVRTNQRDRVRGRLALEDIATDIHYPYPDYLQPSCQDLDLHDGYLPVTEQTCSQVLTLPCFPEMTLEEIHLVVDSVTQALTTD